MKILAFPRDNNPYQELLYRPMRRNGIEVAYLEGPTGSHTLNLLMMPLVLLARRLRGFNTLHVHWTYPFRVPFSSGTVARSLMELLAAMTWLFAKLLGMKLIWTAHNARPHEPLFLDDRRAHRFLGNVADRVIVHSAAAELQLHSIGVRNKQVKIIPHGSYIGVYPDETTRGAARKRLDLPADAKVFLFFGLIRPYKGVEQLLKAFSALEDKKAILLIAGQVQDATLMQTIENAAKADSRLRLMLKRIDDDQLQYIFRAADFTVLPYERSTTSGVSLLSASFACPIVAPDQAAFADIPNNIRISYAVGGLDRALQLAASISEDDHQAKSAAARRYAESLTWDDIASQTLTFLEHGR